FTDHAGRTAVSCSLSCMAWSASSRRSSPRGWRIDWPTSRGRSRRNPAAELLDSTARQLAPRPRVEKSMTMHDEDLYSRHDPRSRRASRATFTEDEARGPIIDQEGREIPADALRARPGAFAFGFGSASPFGNPSREQRLARLEAIAKLLDVAFVLPGTKIRYGVDGIIGVIPVIGDIIATALSLWLVREARALGAPWHVTARML